MLFCVCSIPHVTLRTLLWLNCWYFCCLVVSLEFVWHSEISPCNCACRWLAFWAGQSQNILFRDAATMPVMPCRQFSNYYHYLGLPVQCLAYLTPLDSSDSIKFVVVARPLLFSKNSSSVRLSVCQYHAQNWITEGRTKFEFAAQILTATVTGNATLTSWGQRSRLLSLAKLRHKTDVLSSSVYPSLQLESGRS